MAAAVTASSFVSTSFIFSPRFTVTRSHSLLPSKRLCNSSKILSLDFLNTRRLRDFEIASNSSALAVQDVVIESESPLDYENLALELEHASPLRIIDEALRIFGNDIAIAFSGAEDVALIEYAHLTGRPFRVFSLDTGRLNPETYAFFDKVEKHYNIHIEYTFPEAEEVQNLVREKGLFSFYKDGHQECCRVRKVRPLKKALKNLRAWITGQRKDQSPNTRAHIPTVHFDPSFQGINGGPNSLVKWNPLANIQSSHLWSFLRALEIPVNTLHSKGFISIGCQPCTRAVQPGQHEREGRWWWEDSKAKECGLHKSNNGFVEQLSVANVNGIERRDSLFESGNVEVLSKEGVEEMVKERKQPWLVVLYAPWCRFCQAMEGEFVGLAGDLVGMGVKVGKFRADGEEDKEFVKRELGFQSFPTVLFFPRYSCRPIKYSSEKRDVDSIMAFVKAVK